jgi:DNA (cytosine-5)-methyltransferase 3A
MNVLSLFDGGSMGQVALNMAGVRVDNYFASEIEKAAMVVTMDNYPNTIQIGDVRNVSYKDGVLTTENGKFNVGKIDLVQGGSPCQTVSLANGGGNDLNSGKSNLFWEYMRLLKEVNPTYFLLENVPMSETNRNMITNAVGFDPIIINSRLVSIQNRKRLYWTNIKNIEQPKDLGLLLEDLHCKEYDDSLVLRGKALNKLDRKRNRAIDINSDKCPTIMKSQEKKPTDSIVFKQDGIYRYPTRRECELMQNLPIGYTKSISYRSATGVIGNGWNVNTIAHIYKGLI